MTTALERMLSSCATRFKCTLGWEVDGGYVACIERGTTVQSGA